MLTLTTDSEGVAALSLHGAEGPYLPVGKASSAFARAAYAVAAQPEVAEAICTPEQLAAAVADWLEAEASHLAAAARLWRMASQMPPEVAERAGRILEWGWARRN